MGYFANGSGDAILKEGVNEGNLYDILEKCVKERNLDMEFDVFDLFDHKDQKVINFWESDSHWHEEDTEVFLNALSPYIPEGSAVYSGEDDCNWKYVFNPQTGEWLTEDGKIVFGSDLTDIPDDDLIEALKKRGYKITKEDMA